MWYVSQSLKDSFVEREAKVVDAIRKSGIDYVRFGIFGSYARGEYTTLSDIDFCIIVNKKPERCLSGGLREEADLLGADIVFVTQQYFNEDNSQFAQQLRRDFKEIQ